MKLVKPMSLLAALLAATSAYAAGVCQETPGQVICGKGVVDHVLSYGATKLTNTTVKHKTETYGDLTAQHVKLNSLKVHGVATLEDSEVSGESLVFGFLSTDNVTFAQPIHLHTNNVRLKKTKAPGIVMEKSMPLQMQEVHIESGSTITGNIEFKQKHGVVWVAKDAQITGKIIGGERKTL